MGQRLESIGLVPCNIAVIRAAFSSAGQTPGDSTLIAHMVRYQEPRRWGDGVFRDAPGETNALVLPYQADATVHHGATTGFSQMTSRRDL